jgi:hypothetical protein
MFGHPYPLPFFGRHEGSVEFCLFSAEALTAVSAAPVMHLNLTTRLNLEASALWVARFDCATEKNGIMLFRRPNGFSVHAQG